jgi:hypothetical protein
MFEGYQLKLFSEIDSTLDEHQFQILLATLNINGRLIYNPIFASHMPCQ